jgi:hypothetical protein
MMRLWASYEKKIWKKQFFLHTSNQWRMESDPDQDPDPEPDPLVRRTDPGIRIRTKMSRIPNTAGSGLTRPRRKGPVVRGQEKGHEVPWQRHHRPRRQRSGCRGTGRGTSRHRCGRHTLPSAGLHTKTSKLILLHFN